MKAFFFLLLAANLGLGTWLLLGEPVDSVREPGRMELQIEPGRFRVLRDADLGRLRGQAAHTAAAAAALAAAAVPKAEIAAAERPSLSCVEIGNFPSESAAKKLRARLAAIGLTDRTSAGTGNRATRVRLSGIDAASEAKIDEILKDFPKQQLEHCAEAASAQ